MNASTNLLVGQEVAIDLGHGHPTHYSFDWKVSKVTPTGQVTVERVASERMTHTRRFCPRGYEIGGAKFGRAKLEPNVALARSIAANHDTSLAALNALTAVQCKPGIRATWGKQALREEVARLTELLDVARLAVENIVEVVPR